MPAPEATDIDPKLKPSFSWLGVCLGRPLLSVLLVHCDPRAAPSLATALEKSGFRVLVDPEPYPRMTVDAADFDVTIIGDIGSLEDRRRLCRQLRVQGYLGAIVAQGEDAQEVARLLDAGANDFVLTSAGAPEMVLRVRVALGRIGAPVRSRWGIVEIDRVRRRVRLRGRVLALTSREYELLACMVEAGGKTVSRSTLLSTAWGLETDRGSNLVEVHLSRLRNKFGADAALIETVRRSGYRLGR